MKKSFLIGCLIILGTIFISFTGQLQVINEVSCPDGYRDWLHVKSSVDAIADPYLYNGNKIVSPFDELLFCGTALVIVNSEKQSNKVGS